MSGLPSPSDGPVVVVGAGTAGCVVAGRLADAGHRVTVLEAGPGQRPADEPASVSLDHLRAQQLRERWHELRVDDDRPYAVGRGLGGSSAVNGLVAEIDLDDPALGPSDEVRAAARRQRLPTVVATDDELGELDRALLASGAGERVPLHRDGATRADIVDAYVRRHLDDGRIELVADAVADHIVEAPSGRVTVSTATGTVVDGAAAVVCAGALATPAILLRSQLGRRVGDGLQDHPSVVIDLTLRGDRARSDVVTGVTVRRGAVQFVPLDHVTVATDPHPGVEAAAVLVSLMTPTRTDGSVRLASDDPAAPPVVRFPPLVGIDLDALRDGVRAAADLLERSPISDLVTGVEFGELGRADLADDELLERWIANAPGVHRHASSSCAIGRSLDADGRVVGTANVHVADASAFPSIPRTGTHLPTIVQAERLVERWLRGKMR